MERKPTRPTPVSHHQRPAPPEPPAEDLLELCISPEEVESLERTARVTTRDLNQQQTNLEWERNRPKPVTVRRKSAIQIACIRDTRYLAAAARKPRHWVEPSVSHHPPSDLGRPPTETPTKPLQPYTNRQPERHLYPFDLRHLLTPPLISPIHEPDYLATDPRTTTNSPDYLMEFDLRYLLTPPAISPIHDLCDTTTTEESSTTTTPADQLFEGITIRWRDRFSRTKNAAGDTVLVSSNRRVARLKHQKSGIETLRIRN